MVNVVNVTVLGHMSEPEGNWLCLSTKNGLWHQMAKMLGHSLNVVSFPVHNNYRRICFLLWKQHWLNKEVLFIRSQSRDSSLSNFEIILCCCLWPEVKVLLVSMIPLTPAGRYSNYTIWGAKHVFLQMNINITESCTALLSWFCHETEPEDMGKYLTL